MPENSIVQRSFSDDIPEIIAPNEPHMACLLLLDTSGSMTREISNVDGRGKVRPIDELNRALNQFKVEVCENEDSRKKVDIAIIAFNDSPKVIQEFSPIEHMKSISLEADGQTNIVPAVRCALDMVRERVHLYHSTGAVPYKPWIILISDGIPTDYPTESVWEIAKEVREKEEQGKLKFFSLGVEGYDSKTLHQFSGAKVMRLTDTNFTSFFGDWLNKSLATISASTPGDRIKGIPLPANIDKDTTSWMND